MACDHLANACRRIGGGALLAATGAFAVAGCHSYQPLQIPETAIAHAVRVQFSTPRSVTAAREIGSDSVLTLVSRLEGKVLAARRDTLSIAVARLTDANGEHDVTSALTVTVVRGPSAAIDVLGLDENKSQVVAVAGGVAVAYVLAIVLVAALIASVFR